MVSKIEYFLRSADYQGTSEQHVVLAQAINNYNLLHWQAQVAQTALLVTCCYTERKMLGKPVHDTYIVSQIRSGLSVAYVKRAQDPPIELMHPAAFLITTQRVLLYDFHDNSLLQFPVAQGNAPFTMLEQRAHTHYQALCHLPKERRRNVVLTTNSV